MEKRKWEIEEMKIGTEEGAEEKEYGRKGVNINGGEYGKKRKDNEE
jgi:hypothetical protein